jgi:taurine dioxygenase
MEESISTSANPKTTPRGIRSVPISIEPLAAPLGAEITGLDMSERFSAELVGALREAFERYHVLVVRGQPITETQQVAFANCFGPVETMINQRAGAELKETMVISNVKEDGTPIGFLADGEIEWHFDKMHQAVPNIAAVLHAVEIPTWGGETCFSDAALIYEKLPEATKRRLEGLHVACAYDYAARSSGERVLTANAPRAVQPLVRSLGDGRKSIYAAPLMVDGIVELPPDESTRLLAELYAHFGRPEFTYEHVWRVGDTLIWDNRCCAHRRNDFDPKQRRLLKRVAIADPSSIQV